MEIRNQFQYDENTAVVSTTHGRIRGYLWNGIYVYKGVPYAKAKRFHAPEPVDDWDGVLDTTSFGYVCPLLDEDRPGGEVLVPHRFGVMNENCQNLNIWTPALDDAKRPVLVWLHGGGFDAGSSIEHIAYEGENMARFGDCVVVTINHRLNLLGYLDLSDFGEEYANSGNAGGDDIIAALTWMRQNILSFGGDPENVTVFGQSGGGAKVTALLQSPAADGLFQKGYIMSGVISGVDKEIEGTDTELARGIMKELGITAEGADGIRELEQADYHDLAKAFCRLRPGGGSIRGMGPHRNAYYYGDPLHHGFRKESAQVPLLIGSVFGEFASFQMVPQAIYAKSREEQEALVREAIGAEGAAAVLPLYYRAYPERRPFDVLRLDFAFRGSEIAYIQERSRWNPNGTYSYLFNADQPIFGGQTPWHCADIPYVFHNTELVQYPNADPENARRLEKEVFESVMAFARTGNPVNAAVPSWKASTPDAESTMVFEWDRPAHPEVNYDHELIRAATQYIGPVLARLQAESMDNFQH